MSVTAAPEPLATVVARPGRITAPALVDAAWLVSSRDAVRVVDTRAADAFATAHIPGSTALPLDALLVDDSSRPALAQLAAATRAALQARGIRPDDHVVLVDDGEGSAALGAVICELAGMRRVSVVHGSGVTAWQLLGESVDTGAAVHAPCDPTTWDDVADRGAIVAAFEDVVDAVVDGTARLLDARSQLEHEGIIGAPCCAARGAIPGSLHLEWTSLFDAFGTPHPADVVVALVDQLGLGTRDPVIVTCHAGHRAAIAARVLRSSGFHDVRVSIGSWHEWSVRGLGGDGSD